MATKISDLKRKKLHIIHPKEKLSVLEDIFQGHDIHHVLVAVMGSLQGIISKGDYLYHKTIKHRHSGTDKDYFVSELVFAEDIMTRCPITIDESASLSEALEIMIENRINALPILAAQELVNIITSYDILKMHHEVLDNEEK